MICFKKFQAAPSKWTEIYVFIVKPIVINRDILSSMAIIVKTIVAFVVMAFLLAITLMSGIGSSHLISGASSQLQQGYNSGPIGIANMTAAVIAYSGEFITGQIDAHGYNFGVYIGPGVKNVVIYHAHIFGASDHGVIAVDTSGISIVDSNISNNVQNPTPTIPDDKEVGFYGVSNSYIVGNVITGSKGDGGISVYSSSSLVPTGLPVPTVNASGNNNFIADNYIANDSRGCGIVVAAWGPGQTVRNNWVYNNVVIGDLMTPHGVTGFSVGTIVIAADFPFSTAVGNVVLDNTVIGGLEDGIIINAQAPGAGDINNEIIGNYVELAGFQRINNPPFDNASDLNLAPAPNGIGIYANVIPQTANPVPPYATGNVVAFNTIANEVIGIWVANANNGAYIGNTFDNVTYNFQSFYGMG